MRSPLPLMMILAATTAVSAPHVVHGQEDGRAVVTVEGAFVQPVFGLGDRFSALGTGSAGFGIWASHNTLVEGRIEYYAFRQGDVRFTDHVMTDDGPLIDADQLNLTLDIVGGAVHVRRVFSPGARMRPFLTAGAGIYHWISRRDPYEDENRSVAALREVQASGGFHGGGGIEYVVLKSVSVDAGIRHSIILGELWPTLHLGLDNVSTFQFTSVRLGLRFQF